MAKRDVTQGEAGYTARIKALRAGLAQGKLDGVLVTDLRNIRYLSGFTGSNAHIIITSKKALFFTDSRYETQASEEVKGFTVRIYRKALDEIAGAVKALKPAVLGFEGGNASYDTYLKLRKALRGIRLKPVGTLFSDLRKTKDLHETALIRESVKVLDSGYDLAMKILRPGVIERDAALEIESLFKRSGAEGLAFDTIIASGFRGALPHGKASEKKIKRGELVVVDMGALKNGYNSDETRTFSIGKATAEQKKVYQTVKDAQERAIEAVRAGVAASEVDRAARGHIEKAGYGKYFGHGTGHGVGLEIHENPSISPLGKDLLRDGMVVTIEPGIYIPGWGGVRIEDMVLVGSDGCEVLTATTKELVCL